MRALLDTGTFLWFISGSDRLSINARNYITDLENELILSVASVWEIAIKSSLGKLELLCPFSHVAVNKIRNQELLKRIKEIEKLPDENQHVLNEPIGRIHQKA